MLRTIPSQVTTHTRLLVTVPSSILTRTPIRWLSTHRPYNNKRAPYLAAPPPSYQPVKSIIHRQQQSHSVVSVRSFSVGLINRWICRQTRLGPSVTCVAHPTPMTRTMHSSRLHTHSANINTSYDHSHLLRPPNPSDGVGPQPLVIPSLKPKSGSDSNSSLESGSPGTSEPEDQSSKSFVGDLADCYLWGTAGGDVIMIVSFGMVEVVKCIFRILS